MRRNPARLTLQEYDVLVVGGGIHGACIAWEAALAGLRVALIEAADFGGATSSNSLRTLHGGLRHLQRLDLPRMRESIRARRDWLRLAPHLAMPLRFVLPTYGHGLRGPQVMRMALWINDLVGFDRNRGVVNGRTLPSGHVWSQKLARAVLSGTRETSCNGAASWYDAVCSNTERLLISVVSAAIGAGAHATNYVRAKGLLRRALAASGVSARDELTGQEFEIRARVVINAAGPWVGDWLEGQVRPPVDPLFLPSKAFNLVTRPLPFREGLGFSVNTGRAGQQRRQTYFIIPWNGRALIGTRHVRCSATARSAAVTQDEIGSFIADLNRVLGRHRLAGSDVIGVYSGLLPEKRGNLAPEVELERAPQVIDHAAAGTRGLFSIVGVKWTTARIVAEQAIQAACGYLGKPRRSVSSAATLWAVEDSAPRRSSVSSWKPDSVTLAHLKEMYGPARDRVLALMGQEQDFAERMVPDLPVIRGQLVEAVRGEMAVQLADIVMRRTPLYLSEFLDNSVLAACAAIAARELRWSQREMAEQIQRTEAQLQAFRGPFSKGIAKGERHDTVVDGGPGGWRRAPA